MRLIDRIRQQWLESGIDDPIEFTIYYSEYEKTLLAQKCSDLSDKITRMESEIKYWKHKANVQFINPNKNSK